MKKLFISILFLQIMVFVSAETCTPEIILLNQDPYPAIPGEYVKLVFQISNLESPECGDIAFKLKEEYPLIFNPGESGIRNFRDVDYIKDYQSTIQIPYEVRIDEDALDGENLIEVLLKNKNNAEILENFNIEVDDPKSDFEIYVKEYDYDSNKLTIEILNVGDSDIEALTLEIEKQRNVIIKGSNRMVAGDLDSNEYTTVDFEAIPTDGEISLNIIYSDSLNKRRTIKKNLGFDSSYFTNRANGEEPTSKSTYVLWAVLVLGLIYWFRKRKK
jgi:hypothetical protein